MIQYELGARGVDSVSPTSSSGTTTLFPVYDGHGNNVAMLQRSGSGYTVGERRSYDAWGAVRSSLAQTGGSSGRYVANRGRYVANLGHKQDDESGLIYMRARYYEPSTGRFVNEDNQRDGHNWFAYCVNDPVNRVDETGKSDLSVGWCAFAAFMISFLYVAAKGKSLGIAFVAGIISAVSAGAVAAGSNAIGQATEMSAIAALGTKIFGGGFVNAVAQLMIDLVTGDTPGGDLVPAFLSGGLGSAFVPAFGGPLDAGFGAFVGSGLQALYDAGVSAFGGG